VPGGNIRRIDIVDTEIVDAVELASDGTTEMISGISVVSTTSSTRRVICSNVDFLYDSDSTLELGDVVILSGTSPGGLADGVYTVSSVINVVTFSVVESIASSTGGSVTIKYPAGALKVGVDPTGLTRITTRTVQEALEELDFSASGITESQHEALDTIIHEIDETSYDEVIYIGNYASSYIVWETASKLKKIREELYTYTSGKITKVITKQYDNAGVLKMTMTEDYTYSGNKISIITRTKS
jgi:hypothetical protein